MTLPHLDGIRRRTRSTSRGVRRVVVGGMLLSPSRTLQWAMGRRRGAGSAVNTSLTWVVADGDRTTRVWVHNYWSDAYGIPSPELRATLLDADGEVAADWTFALPPDATEVVDVATVVAAAGRPAPFEGHLLLKVEHEKLAAGRPVQVLAEYVRVSDGETTGVHGQYGLMTTPVAQVVGGIRVEAASERRTSLVLTNSYDGPGGPGEFRPTIEVRNEAGESRRVRLGPLRPLATRRVYLDEIVPGLAGFLHDRPGHASVTLPVPASRVATLTEFGDRWLANHGTIDRVFDQAVGVPSAWTASRPVASAMVRCSDDTDTTLTFPNMWGPIAADYCVTVTVFDPAGVVVATHEAMVPRGGMRTLSAREILADRVELPFVGHAEVRVSGAASLTEQPAVVDLLVGIVRHGELVGEVQVGGEFFNAPVPPGGRMPDVRRTRTFGRVEIGPALRSFVYLSNPSGADDYQVVARPVFTLLRLDGTVVATSEAEIAPRGCLLFDVRERFGLSGDDLSDGRGILRVRDTGARLFGYYFAESARTKSVPICHLLGG